MAIDSAALAALNRQADNAAYADKLRGTRAKVVDTRKTPPGRPCLTRSELTFFAAFAVSFTSRSSPVR